MAHNLKLSYIPISSGVLDMRRALTVNYYALGIVIDLDCPRSEVILEEVIMGGCTGFLSRRVHANYYNDSLKVILFPQVLEAADSVQSNLSLVAAY